MPRGICPVCDQLVGISPTGETIAVGWTARWWRVDMHAAVVDGPHRGTICAGSGKRV